jgi:hypothetical protein
MDGEVRRVFHASPRLLPSRRNSRDGEPLFRRRALGLVKSSARSIVRARPDERRIVLIFGCQRSGTTMLQQTFLDRSWRVLILEEHDRRLVGAGSEPEETTWQEYSTVVERIRRLPFEVVAAKPLVESASATALMDAAGAVKAVWMLRHYQEVARSNVGRFGADNPFRDLQPIRARDTLDWRYRGVTLETCETVTALLNRKLTPFDAAALFWWTRNQLYFEQRLWADDRIRILRYERACNQSDEVIRSLSDHIGLALPPGSIASRIRPQPSSPKTRALDPDVERLCRRLWDSFEGHPELLGAPIERYSRPTTQTGTSTSRESLRCGATERLFSATTGSRRASRTPSLSAFARTISLRTSKRYQGHGTRPHSPMYRSRRVGLE